MTQGNIAGIFEESHLGKKGKKAREEQTKKLVNYAPEVMVKVTGFTTNFKHMKSHLEYITRNGKLELEDEQGNIYQGKEEVEHIFKHWKSKHWDCPRYQDKTRCTASIVLSMPNGTDEKALKDSVREFAKKNFADYRYVMALHTDTDSPHVHLTVQSCAKERRKRLHIKKGDPQLWREAFAHELDERGIDAEATPRAERGIILKSVSQALKHMKDRGIKPYTVKGIISDIREIWGQEKENIKPRPWEAKIKERQEKIRKSWLDLAEEFKETDKELSDKIISFVKKMPPIQTKRESINEKIFNSVRDKTKAEQLVADHPELENEVVKILLAEQYADEKYQDRDKKEAFMKRVVSDIANKRLNGERIEPIMMKENERQKERTQAKDRDIER